MITRQFFSIAQWFSILDLPPDDLRRRSFLALCVLILMPLSLAFGLYNLQKEGWSATTLLCIVGTLNGLLYLASLRYSLYRVTALRFALAYALFMITTILAVGGGDGLGYCWFYFFPLIAYYIFGTREGLRWVTLSWIAALAFGVLNVGS